MGRHRVVDIVVRHRPDDGQLVGPLGKQWKMLTDADIGHLGRDRLKRPAHLGRSIRFQIPGILLGGPTPHEEQNAGLGLPEA
jgi:hypothetical protein